VRADCRRSLIAHLVPAGGIATLPASKIRPRQPSILPGNTNRFLSCFSLLCGKAFRSRTHSGLYDSGDRTQRIVPLFRLRERVVGAARQPLRVLVGHANPVVRVLLPRCWVAESRLYLIGRICYFSTLRPGRCFEDHSPGDRRDGGKSAEL